MNHEREEGELSEDEKCLFIRKERESSNDENSEDEWDDSQLVKEYERAVSKAKQQILTKLKSEMELTDADIQDVFSDLKVSSPVKKKKNKKNKKSKPKWDIGSACRAFYTEDGEEYEAEIVELLVDDFCRIKYAGYNNEEVVLLSDLKPSEGKHAIHLQILQANYDKSVQEALKEEESIEFSNSQDRQNNDHENMPLPREGCWQNRKAQRHFNTIKRPPFAHHHFPPPPPPPPMALGQSERPMDDEALNSMLMSWYMCGYYTGYYQRTRKDS